MLSFSHVQVAAMLLKRYKEKFSGNPLGATWGYLRQMARDSLPPNPLVSHDTQPSHLRDPAFLVKTLRCATPANPLMYTFCAAQNVVTHT